MTPTLVWERFAGHGHPADREARLRGAGDPRGELERPMTEHIGAVLGLSRRRITQWDAVNEPLDFSNEQLVSNEQLSLHDDAHAERFLEIVRHLHDTGVPIHRVGLQSHLLMTSLRDPGAILSGGRDGLSRGARVSGHHGVGGRRSRAGQRVRPRRGCRRPP